MSGIKRYRAQTSRRRYLHYAPPSRAQVGFKAYDAAVESITAELEPGEYVISFVLELQWPDSPPLTLVPGVPHG